jgi:hypothetical protein
MSLSVVKQNWKLFRDSVRLNRFAQRKISKHPDARKQARSTQLLNFPNSTAVAWVWNPVRPYFQAVNRDQTLGLRSVVPLASSSRSLNRPNPEPPNDAEVRSYVSLAYSEYRTFEMWAT